MEQEDLERPQVSVLVLLGTKPKEYWYPNKICTRLGYNSYRAISILEGLVRLGLVKKEETGSVGHDYIVRYKITNSGKIRAREERSKVAKALSRR
jgi:DNA-binding MarR family transcriptional regulator